MATWANQDKTKKGKFIKYFFTHADFLPTDRATGDKAYDNVGGEDLGTYLNNNYILKADMIAFRDLLLLYFPRYLDSMSLSIRNSVGDVEIAEFWGDTLTPTTATVGVKNYVRGGLASTGSELDTGIAHEQFKRTLKENAIRTPDTYVKDANTALTQIDSDILVVYQKSFDKYVNEYKYPIEKAKEMAISDMKEYKKLLLKQYNSVYDNKYYEEAGKKIFKS